MERQVSEIRAVMEANDGIASLEQLQRAGISRMMVYAGLMNGIIHKESHGNYSMADNQPDEFRIIQSRSGRVVFSHATALYLQGLMEAVPVMLDITVPQGDNVSKIKRDHDNTRFHYCRKDLWELGLTRIITPGGFSVNAYDPERCICDMIRDKKNIEIQIYVQALRQYFSRCRDSRKILDYSVQLKVEEKVRTYMEVLQPM